MPMFSTKSEIFTSDQWRDLLLDPELATEFLNLPPDTLRKEPYFGILSDHGTIIQNLKNRDPEVIHQAVLERVARHAAAEVCTEGHYSKDTLLKIMNLDVDDIRLVLKRTQEISALITDLFQQTSATIGVAGV